MAQGGWPPIGETITLANIDRFIDHIHGLPKDSVGSFLVTRPFFVWPDGFEAYLAARQAAGASGYAAGWELVTGPAEHQISLNKYGIGTKPPPPPPDQKKPAAPDVLD